MTEPAFRRERPRPKEVPTESHKMSTARGAVYVRVGMDAPRTPVEVFVDTGVSGGFTRSFCESLGMLISKSLQNGTRATEIVDSLLGVSDGKMAVDNGDHVYSIPDAVGLAMVRTMHDRAGQPVRGDAMDDPPDGLPAAGTEPTDVEGVVEVEEQVVPEELEEMDASWQLFKNDGKGDAP